MTKCWICGQHPSGMTCPEVVKARAKAEADVSDCCSGDFDHGELRHRHTCILLKDDLE